jgi:hypothetical protein
MYILASQESLMVCGKGGVMWMWLNPKLWGGWAGRRSAEAWEAEVQVQVLLLGDLQ